MPTRRKPKANVGILLKILAAVSVTAVALFLFFNNQPPTHSDRMQEFFSDDDGDSWFADDGTKIAPFDHNGKPAVMVKVYQTPAGKPFVVYMMKFTDNAARQITDAQKAQLTHAGPATAELNSSSGLLVKKPHDPQWIPDTDPRAADMMKVVGPDGSTGCTPVRP